ncbi:TNF receptor-associated factor family protein DDB_G0272098-like [Condylostylus longicornis]|uniref:TNF receptor-associated factor family protein DDB_G0272098-like n=1 Tax=Condylostylus longicornis TaxID=2530218 RepID=UPI00244E1D06|nr:TNF receptor-associated factor family protein DDB_G0272098-like [Condylostylus longicornis]
MDFGELKDDKNFVENVTNFANSIKQIDEEVTKCIEFRHYDKLTTEEKVKFDLFLSYTMNSLYWMYVKLQGMDPNEHGIKNEISRVRQAMIRNKQVYESKTLRPTVDKEAAGRFIKHGIHYREDRNQNDEHSNVNIINEDTNQKNISSTIPIEIENENQMELEETIKVQNLENVENVNSESIKTHDVENTSNQIDENIEDQDEEPGKFVRIRKEDIAENVSENDSCNIEGDDTIYSVSDTSDNEKPIVKKLKNNNNGIIEMNTSKKDSSLKKKKKKKRKNMGLK